MADEYKVLYLATLDEGYRSFDEVSEARSVPGNEITFTVGKPRTDKGTFRMSVEESDVSLSTDGPRAGSKDTVEKSSKTIVCDLAKRECDVDVE